MCDEALRALIAPYPVCQYGVIAPGDLPFSVKVRAICRAECPCYGTSWSCPPAVGNVRACRERLMSYKQALVFTTVAEVTDTAVLEETLATRAGHEAVVRALAAGLSRMGADVLPLSAQVCQSCGRCAYPAPCPHPEKRIACVESHGILVTDLAERLGIAFYQDCHTVTWFGVILFT